MQQFLLFTLTLIYITVSFPQKDTTNFYYQPDQEQWVHQYIVREAYKLLKEQIEYDIPILQAHIGTDETGDMAFIPGNLVVRRS